MIGNTVRFRNGFSLIELMVAMAIGMIIFLGLSTVFVNSLRGQKELTRAAEQVENGRFALDTISSDLRMAGYYGQWQPTTVPTSIADACKVPASQADLDAMLANFGHAVVAYNASVYASGAFGSVADLSGASSCSTLLSSRVAAGSDVLVVRHADADALAVSPVAATAVQNEIYLQANVKEAQLQLGNGAALTTTSKANGTAATIMAKGATVAAEIRKFRLHVYFVDKTELVPTLKRLELKSVNNVLKMDIASIAEGIEAMTVDFGIDALNSDGVIEATSRDLIASQYGNAMVVNVRILARNADSSADFLDDKIYNMGLVGNYGPRNDAFRRHLFSAAVRLVNPAGRRDGGV